MKKLRRPEREEIEQLREAVEFNLDEQKYFDEMKKRRDSQFSKENYQKKIEFYIQELQGIDGKFGERVAVERRLKYCIGHAYECLGTFTLEGHDTKERVNMFEQSVLWYQLADEIVGFLSDYSLRQAEACFGAAYYRHKAGLEDEVTKLFAQRGNQLLSEVLGQDVMVIHKGDDFLNYLEQLAEEKVDGVVKASFLKSKTLENKAKKAGLN